MKEIMLLRKVSILLSGYRLLTRLSIYFRRIYSINRELIIEDFDNNLKFKINLKSHMESYIFWRKYYSYHEIMCMKYLLNEDSIFMDVGANKGELTLAAANHVKNGMVYSFEPVSYLFNSLKNHVEINNLSNVNYYQLGLGLTNDILPIFNNTHELYEDNTIHEGLFTLYPSKTRSKEYETIKIVNFDQYNDEFIHLDKLDGIKMDIEGNELFALKGMEQTIKKFKPFLIIEINEETSTEAGYDIPTLMDYMKNLDYDFYQIEIKGRFRLKTRLTKVEDYNTLAGKNDILFIHSSKNSFQNYPSSFNVE